jgi:hypothetical protein
MRWPVECFEPEQIQGMGFVVIWNLEFFGINILGNLFVGASFLCNELGTNLTIPLMVINRLVSPAANAGVILRLWYGTLPKKG